MEISSALKKDIKSIQLGLAKAIQNHQSFVLKLKEDPSAAADIKVELSKIQKQIIELNEKQKALLLLLRKEIEENIPNGQLPVYNFNMYKVKPGQLESKKRRRKDLSLAPKIQTYQPTCSPPSLSPSPTPSSSSSMSDDSLDYDVSPFMLPVPVPKPRPKLLPDSKDSLYLSGVSRRDLRPPKMKKRQKILSDEEVFKDIPVYYDPVPSPPPTDERDLKARFMTALNLIPKEMLSEIQNRKVERKRRSTATNNPNFVYNNDWEIPVWKRSKTYLSPHKVPKVETVTKKCKTEEEGKAAKKDKENEPEKPARLFLDDVKLPPGLVVEKVDAKSRNSTPDPMVCFVCRASGLLSVCKECTACYHLSCLTNGVSCPNCKGKGCSPENSSEESSSKEEFASKCPNVAESYNKLKEYIENHSDSDHAALLAERENYKMELVIKNQELYGEKDKLEKRAGDLSEALMLQEDSKNELLNEEQSILAKIKVITDFVTIFQKSSKKPNVEGTAEEKSTPEPVEPEAKSISMPDLNRHLESDEDSERDLEGKHDQESSDFERDLEEKRDQSENQPEIGLFDNLATGEDTEEKSNLDLGENSKVLENCDSSLQSSKDSLPGSRKHSESPVPFSQESIPNSPANLDNYNTPSLPLSPLPSYSSNGSMAFPGAIDENSLSASSKGSITNPLFEFDEVDEPFTSQSLEKSFSESETNDVPSDEMDENGDNATL